MTALLLTIALALLIVDLYWSSVYVLVNNWESTLLDARKEQDLLKRGLLRDNGILRNLHFLEQAETDDNLKSAAERRSASAKDPPRYVERLRELVASPGKVEAQVDSCAPSAAQIPADNFNGFPPPGGNANFEDWPIDLFHPIAEYTKGMIDWDAAQKMDASYTPSYADVPSDPA
ncbi:hypothetical protein I308_100037 [Cryptococcus tetragattii IND107]|uniref:Uncharacterized protein n=1 Tax=Cryptococcus tetragattii IND107 TaxID=1296105 RepID=A0ABR3C4G1_9TREE